MQLWASVRGRGIIVNVAIFPTTELVWKNPNAMNRHQLTITGSNIYTRGEFQEVIDAIASGEPSIVDQWQRIDKVHQARFRIQRR